MWPVALKHERKASAYAAAVTEEQVLIERGEIAVMFRRVADEQAAIARGMAEVEAAVGLRGRKYYGAFDADGDEYRVCVQLRESDDPEALGLEVGTLPGGSYARVRLIGEPPAVYGLRAGLPATLRAPRPRPLAPRDRVLPPPGHHRPPAAGRSRRWRKAWQTVDHQSWCRVSSGTCTG
jgi:hypothetical protein